jgi:hypothetical protein
MMKVFLMYPDRDFQLGEGLPPNAAELTDVWRQLVFPVALTRRFCYRARVVASLKMLPKVKAPRRAK